MTFVFLFLLGQDAQSAVNDLNGENNLIVGSLYPLFIVPKFIFCILFVILAQKKLQVKQNYRD